MPAPRPASLRADAQAQASYTSSGSVASRRFAWWYPESLASRASSLDRKAAAVDPRLSSSSDDCKRDSTCPTKIAGKHKRLRGSYQPLMRSRPRKAAHINRITSELAAVEGLLTFSGATRPDRVTQGCTICCGSRWVGEDHRLLPWNMTAAVRPVLRACAIGLKRSSGARFLPRCHLVPTSNI